MKKTKGIAIMIVLGILCINGLMAQTNKGQVFMGVSTAFAVAGTGPELMGLAFITDKYKSDAEGFEESDPDKQTCFTLLPRAGYIVVNGLVIGLDITFTYNKWKDGVYDDNMLTETLFATGPFVRYYFPVDKVKPYIEASGVFGSSKSKYEYEGGKDEYKYGVRSILGGVGMGVPIGNHVTFDVMTGYNSLVRKSKDDNPNNYRHVYGAFGFRFGFIVFIGGGSDD